MGAGITIHVPSLKLLGASWDQVDANVVQQTIVEAEAAAISMHASHNWNIQGAANWRAGGGIMIQAPSLKLLGASWQQLDASLIQTTDIKLEATRLSASMTGIAAAHTSVKAERAEFSMSSTGLSLTDKGSFLENDGFNLKKTGLMVVT